jgi:hypothetical protein
MHEETGKMGKAKAGGASGVPDRDAPEGIELTDHFLVRWMERVHGVDMSFAHRVASAVSMGHKVRDGGVVRMIEHAYGIDLNPIRRAIRHVVATTPMVCAEGRCVVRMDSGHHVIIAKSKDRWFMATVLAPGMRVDPSRPSDDEVRAAESAAEADAADLEALADRRDDPSADVERPDPGTAPTEPDGATTRWRGPPPGSPWGPLEADAPATEASLAMTTSPPTDADVDQETSPPADASLLAPSADASPPTGTSDGTDPPPRAEAIEAPPPTDMVEDADGPAAQGDGPVPPLRVASFPPDRRWHGKRNRFWRTTPAAPPEPEEEKGEKERGKRGISDASIHEVRGEESDPEDGPPCEASTGPDNETEKPR